MTRMLSWVMVILMWGSPVLADILSDCAAQEFEFAISDFSRVIPIGTRIGVDNLKGDNKDNDVTDYLMTALTKAGYMVLDRRNLDEIFKQQGLELDTFLFDPETSSAKEKIHGVNAVVYGTVKEASELVGKAELNVHLQCTFLKRGSTPWAYDVIADCQSGTRANFFWFVAGGFLIFIVLVYIAVKASGKSTVITKH